MKIIILFIACSFFSNTFYCQENSANIWYFADHAGLNFSTGIPIPITDGQTDVYEGTATLCDIHGNLIFYTDGTKVWNKDHGIMPNGADLMGNPSATQSALITPYPQNDSLYIVFTVDARENSLINGLRYSIINVNLDGGLGDITAEKNILLHAPVCEKLTSIIKTNQSDFWIIAHDWGNSDFLSYSITDGGVNTTPVVSSVGSIQTTGGGFSMQYSIGYMKASRDGQKIAVANYRDIGFFELFDFDVVTGQISNGKISDASYYRPYGIEFSPDCSKLYGSIDGGEYTNGKIYQFDLSLSDPLDSPILIASSTNHLSGLQLGPDGKIYVSIKNTAYLGVISLPNFIGPLCNYIHNAVFLEEGIAWRGLPSLFYYKGFEFFTGSELDTTICQGDSIFLQNAFQTIEGTYYDTLQNEYGWDSILNINLFVLEVLPNPEISLDEGILSSTFANNYQWYYNGNIIAGANSQMYQPFITGYYNVAVNNGENLCWSFSSEFYFEYVNIPEIVDIIEIFPNPFISSFVIKCNKPFSFTLKDFFGKTILAKDQPTNSKTVYIPQIKSGMYFLNVSTVNGSFVKKIVKE